MIFWLGCIDTMDTGEMDIRLFLLRKVEKYDTLKTVYALLIAAPRHPQNQMETLGRSITTEALVLLKVGALN